MMLWVFAQGVWCLAEAAVSCAIMCLGWLLVQEFIDSGRMWEKSRNYPLAIEAYLSVNRTHDSDPDRLNEVWQHALRLASEHEKHGKYVELADDVAHRCVACKCASSAAN